MTKYVSGIVQRASPNVGEGRIRPAGRSLGTPGLNGLVMAWIFISSKIIDLIAQILFKLNWAGRWHH